jgi:hypothetical protein
MTAAGSGRERRQRCWLMRRRLRRAEFSRRSGFASLYETFDIGQDTGTSVLEEYDSKMPYPFTGTLTKFVVVLEPQKLSDDEQRRLHAELAKAMMAVQ